MFFFSSFCIPMPILELTSKNTRLVFLFFCATTFVLLWIFFLLDVYVYRLKSVHCKAKKYEFNIDYNKLTKSIITNYNMNAILTKLLN